MSSASAERAEEREENSDLVAHSGPLSLPVEDPDLDSGWSEEPLSNTVMSGTLPKLAEAQAEPISEAAPDTIREPALELPVPEPAPEPLPPSAPVLDALPPAPVLAAPPPAPVLAAPPPAPVAAPSVPPQSAAVPAIAKTPILPTAGTSPVVPTPVIPRADSIPDWNALRPPGIRSLLSTPPNGAWLASGAALAVVTFALGILVGRSTKEAPVLPPAPAPAPADTAFASPASTTPARAPVEATTTATAAAPAPSDPAPPFDANAAKSALDRAAEAAGDCRVHGDPQGSVQATVTFTPAGRAETTISTPRYAGTKTGRCIIAKLSEARVPAFTGNPVTLRKSVAVR